MTRQPWNIIEREEAVPLLRSAERLLFQAFSTHFQVSWKERIPDYRHVLRCSTADRAGRDGPAIILKTPQREDRRRRLFNHITGLEFLESLWPAERLWPRLYGMNADLGLVVCEDLGKTTLATILHGQEAGQGAKALVSLALTLGRMQTLSADKDRAFRAMQEHYGPLEESPHFDIADYLLHSREAVRVIFETMQVETDASFWQAYTAFAERLRPTGPFLTYTVSDVGTENCVVCGDTVKLIDFDWSHFRSALIDGVCGRTLYTYPEVYIIPEVIQERMEQEYRSALIQGCPAAGDDALFAEAVTDACGFWMFYYLLNFVPRLLNNGFEADFLWPQKMVCKMLDAFVSVSKMQGPLQDAASQLKEQFWKRQQGRDLTISPFPAFQSQVSSHDGRN